jgi:hypothetical protein
MTEPTLTPAKLWKQITSEQRLDVARAFWADEDASDDQIQAVLLIAQQKKFRSKFVLGLDLDRKSKHLATLLSLPDAMAARALVVYHLARQREMMGTFLDALGITHENGLIQDDDVKPDAASMAPAAATLREKFPPQDVALYLSTLLCQDPDTWGPLADVPEQQLRS